MRYPVFLVNLDRQSERLRFMTAQLAALGVTATRFPAVNGRDPAERARADAASYAQLTPGEIGCFESHRRIWQKMVDDNIEAAFVIEDDMIVADDFATLDIPPAVLAEVDLIKIDYAPTRAPCYGSQRLALTPRRAIVRQMCTEVSTGCYFVSLAGARKLLSVTRNYMLPVDTMMFNVDTASFWQLRVWKLQGAAATQLSMIESLTGQLHADFEDRIQGAARPELEKGLAASIRRLRVRLRRLLDRDTRAQRQARAERHRQAFAATQPLETTPILFDGGDLGHFERARHEPGQL